jgi:hypothetical protein
MDVQCPRIVCWKDSSFLIKWCRHPCQTSTNHSLLSAQSYSVHLWMYPYASIILLCLVWFCSKFWNREMWIFQPFLFFKIVLGSLVITYEFFPLWYWVKCLFLVCWVILSWKGVELCFFLFSSSLRWSCDFPFCYYILYQIDVMLNHSCSPWMKFKILFVSILLGSFLSILIRGISLRFSFLWYHYLPLILGVVVRILNAPTKAHVL